MKFIKETARFFQNFANLYAQGKDISEQDELRRSAKLANDVYIMLGSEGWNGLRIKLIERMEAQLKLLLQDTKLGRVTDADLRQRMTPVLGAIELMDAIDQTLLDGQRDSVKLEQLLRKVATQEQTSEELAYSAT